MYGLSIQRSNHLQNPIPNENLLIFGEVMIVGISDRSLMSMKVSGSLRLVKHGRSKILKIYKSYFLTQNQSTGQNIYKITFQTKIG